MDLLGVKILWDFYKRFMTNPSESFNGYSLLDRAYYLSRMILQAIDAFGYRKNPLMRQEIRVPIKKDALKTLYIFDSIAADAVVDAMADIPIYINTYASTEQALEYDYDVRFPIFMGNSNEFVIIRFNQASIPIEDSENVVINMIVGYEEEIDDINIYYHSSAEIDPDYDLDNNYGDDYLNMARFLLEASSGVLSICKIIEASQLDVEREIEKNHIDYDYYGNDGLDNLLFEKAEKYFSTVQKYINLLSDKKDIKNSKHLDWLDRAKARMGIHIFTKEELVERTAQTFIERLECVSITGNGRTQNGLIVPDNIRNDIKTLLATRDNYGNPYDLMISCVSEQDPDNGGFKSSFPTVLVFHDNKIDTLEKLEDDMLKPSANNLNSWLTEELESRDIDEDMISYGNNLMGYLKFDDNGTIVSSDDSPLDIVDAHSGIVQKKDNESTKNEIGVVNVEEEKEELTPFKISCMIADSMENKFFDTMIAQMAIDTYTLKIFADVIGDITKLSYNEYYSDKYISNDISFQDIFTNDTIVLNIVANGHVIDSLLFYATDDDKLECTRIYDKIHTSISGFTSAFARACKFSKTARLSFNLCTHAGFYNADLTKLLEFMNVPTDAPISDKDLTIIKYDVTMYTLSILRQALLNRYVKTINGGGEHFIKDSFNFNKVIKEYNFSEVLSAFEDLLSSGDLTKEDIRDIKKLTEASMDDINEYDFVDCLDNNDGVNIDIIFFNGLVGQTRNGEIVIGKDAGITPVLFKKGLSFSIMKNEGSELLFIIEDLGKTSNYDFSMDLIKICSYLNSDFYEVTKPIDDNGEETV